MTQKQPDDLSGEALNRRRIADYCGCCGRECIGLWCPQCFEHISPICEECHAK